MGSAKEIRAKPMKLAIHLHVHPKEADRFEGDAEITTAAERNS
jgi:hypothetical protein